MLTLALTSAAPVPQLEPGWPVAIKSSFTITLTPFGGGIFCGSYYSVDTSAPRFGIEIHRFFPDGREPKPWPLEWLDMGFQTLNPCPVADLDGDGNQEALLAGSDLSGNFSEPPGWVLVDLNTGKARRIKGIARTWWSAPTLYDSDGDNTPEAYWVEARFDFSEVAIYRFDPVRWCLDSILISQNPPPAWFVRMGTLTQCVGDLDGDGEPELAMAFPSGDSQASKITLVDPGEFSPEDSFALPWVLLWGPRAGDLDGDGAQEILVSTGHIFTGQGIDSVAYWVLDISSAQTHLIFKGDRDALAGWPAFADIDGDNLPEIVISLYENDRYVFYALGGVGDTVARLEVPGTLRNLYAFGDVDGDSRDDWVYGLQSAEGRPGMQAFDFLTGQLLWSVTLPPYDTSEKYNSAFLFLWDVDGDEKPEMMGAKALPDSQEVFGYKFLSLFELPVQNPHLGWPMLYHDPWNTNNYDFWPPQVGVRESSGKTQGSLTLKPTLKGLLVRSPKPQKLPLKVYNPAGRLLYKAELTLKPGESLVEIPGKGVRLVMVGRERVKVVGK